MISQKNQKQIFDWNDRTNEKRIKISKKKKIHQKTMRRFCTIMCNLRKNIFTFGEKKCVNLVETQAICPQRTERMEKYNDEK